MDLVENRGSGIRAMMESMRAAHMAPPKFTNKHTSFKVTFFNHTLLDKETVEWLNKFSLIVLNDNQRFALAYLKRNPFAPKLTNRDYQRINSVDSIQATRELGDMVKRAGVLVQHGTRGGAYYTLSDWVLDKNQQVEPLFEPELSEKEKEIIDYVRTHGFVTNSLCRQLLKIDVNAANYLLTSMNRKHLLKRTGKGRWTKYTL